MKKVYFAFILFVILIIIASCGKREDVAPAPSSLSDTRARLLARQVSLLTGNESTFHIEPTKSMLPILDSNTYVVVEKVSELNALKVGDIIIYKNALGQRIAHKIVEVGDFITTKGTNNAVADNQKITLSDIEGRVFCVVYGTR